MKIYTYFGRKFMLSVKNLCKFIKYLQINVILFFVNLATFLATEMLLLRPTIKTNFFFTRNRFLKYHLAFLVIFSMFFFRTKWVDIGLDLGQGIDIRWSGQERNGLDPVHMSGQSTRRVTETARGIETGHMNELIGHQVSIIRSLRKRRRNGHQVSIQTQTQSGRDIFTLIGRKWRGGGWWTFIPPPPLQFIFSFQFLCVKIRGLLLNDFFDII